MRLITTNPLKAAATIALGAAIVAAVTPFTQGDVSTAQAPGAIVLPEAPASGELGFILTSFWPAIVPGMKENCPAGFVNTVEKNYLAMQTDAERTRLTRPENALELEARWKATGPNHTNVCSNFDQYPERPTNKTVQNPTSFGLDLDGKGSGAETDGYTCGHENFSTPDGAPGIDNQLYRALGCSTGWRGPDGAPGEIAQVYKNYLTTGEYKIVMLLRGVQSLRDDPDVEVILASTTDLLVTDSQGDFVPGATYRISENPRWRNVLKGRIVGGVLETEPGDVVLSRRQINAGPRGQRSEWNFDRGRLKLQFQSDGSFRGLLGGYQPLFSVINLQVNAGVGSAFVVNLDCAADYNTVKALADGGRDPKTGQCNRISSAWQVSGVPAYVLDVKPGAKKRKRDEPARVYAF